MSLVEALEGLLRDPLPAELAGQPAMTTRLERQLLYNLARHDCPERGAIIDLGAFFGASSCALAAGLRDRRDGRGGPRVWAIDRFECASRGMFGDYVRAYAQRFGLARHLEESGGRLDFHACFFATILPFDDWIEPLRGTLAELRWDSEIGLLHVDMPKNYAQLRLAADGLLPHLCAGALVVFQDFVYHWSAELAAAVAERVAHGFFQPLALCETSLVLRVARVPGPGCFAALDARMAQPDAVLGLLGEAIELVEGAATARNILRLARAQYLHAGGRTAEAERAIEEVLRDAAGEAERRDLGVRVAELRRFGFLLDLD